MARQLKVYRTPIGFHDAYVAAPSQKAALEAWETDKNLFARGAAEIVTDPKLTAEPLNNPGKVIKLTRGDLSDHLAAAAPMPGGKPRRSPHRDDEAPAKSASKPVKSAKPVPRPSRHPVDEAESALREFEERSNAAIAALKEKEAELRQEREKLERDRRVGSEKLASRLEKAETRYRAALDRWRES